jgi:hypothetical protein
VEHFRANEKPEALPREGPRLSEAEREAVVASIQEFQLGESSEGRHLHRLATEYARQTGDEDYLRAVEYFIREEQRHAHYLRNFLALEGFGTVKQRWADTVFQETAKSGRARGLHRGVAHGGDHREGLLRGTEGSHPLASPAQDL